MLDDLYGMPTPGGPTHVVVPAPVLAPPVVAPSPFLAVLSTVFSLATVGFVLVVLGVHVKDWLWPSVPAPPSPAFAYQDAVEAGKAFIPDLAGSLGQGFIAGAAGLEAGQTVPEANKALKSTFEAARNAAFKAKMASVLSKYLPEGTEPATPAARAAAASSWRAVAKGLEGGK